MKQARKPTDQTFEAKIRAFARDNPGFRRRFTDIEIAAMFGVSRQRVHQVLGPYRGSARRRAPNRQQPRANPASVRERLRELAMTEPDFRDRYTAPELAARFGVTPQRMQQIIGPLKRDGRAVARARAERAFRELIHARPAAVLPLQAGGMTMAAIREATGISEAILRDLWTQLKLPSRAADPMGDRRVLRRETCVECGRSFDWTAGQERNYRHGRRRAVTCGIRCGTRYAHRRKREAAARSC
jgi:hypothetical protein